MYFKCYRMLRIIALWVVLIGFHALSTRSAFAQQSSGFAKGPEIETGKIFDNFHVHVKTRSSTEANGRFMSMMVAQDSLGHPVLAFSLSFQSSCGEHAEVTELVSSAKPGVVFWKATSMISGRRFDIIYTAKYKSNGEIADILVVSDQVFNLSDGRDIVFADLDQRQYPELVDQSKALPSAEYIAEMTDAMQLDIAAFKED